MAQAGAVAAVYAVLTIAMLMSPWQLGWGFVQLRLSEAVTVLAAFTPAAIPGLAIGAAVGNAWNIANTGAGVVGLLDVAFGSLGSLLGAVWTWRARARPALAVLGPVVSNALIVPAYLPLMLKAAGVSEIPFLGVRLDTAWPLVYAYGVVTVGLGQAIVMYGLGLPLYHALRRTGLKSMLAADRDPASGGSADR